MSPRKSPAGVNLIEFLAVTVRKRCFWAILVVVSWALLAPAAWHSTAYGCCPDLHQPGECNVHLLHGRIVLGCPPAAAGR